MRNRPLVILMLGLSWLTLASCAGETTEPTASPSSGPSLTANATPLAFQDVKAGWDHSCGLTTDARIYCWGRNQGGQIGDGTLTSRFTPVPILSTLRFVAVATGAYHSCAITTENRLFCWGWNSRGQIGTGSTAYNIPTPTEVSGGRRWLLVDGGQEHTCAITTDDRAFCWGRNKYGQLGTNDLTNHSTPVAVVGGRRWLQLGVGYSTTCGVTTSKKGYCWGWNQKGEIGDGTLLQRNAPTAVHGGLLFRQIKAGQQHTCGLTTVNRAYCWGDDLHGNLGNGPGQTEPSLVPSRVLGELLFRQIGVGDFYTSCGTTTDNKAYCWGNNSVGQIGDGTLVDRPTPRAVSRGLVFDRVSPGGIHTCGVTTTHKAYCWGAGIEGALGRGNEEGSLVPVFVAGQM